MPLSPQITVTPEDLVFKSFDISAVTYTSTAATYTAAGHTFAVGDTVTVTGLAPDGFNGTFVITAVATNTFTVANTTNTALTDQVGNAYWLDPTEYSMEGSTAAYVTDNNDVDAIVTGNAQVAAAYAAALQAQADAATAISDATNALNNSIAAGQQAQAASLAASTAQTTANGKNKVTYSYATPGATANNVGDIWFQYGSSGAQLNKIVAQFAGLGGTSWQSTFVDGLNIANINAGNITTGIITAAVGINNPSGNFSVDGATGVLRATGAIIDGALTVRNGTIVGTLTSSTAIITGTLYINNAVATGTMYITSGYIGDATNGWQFSSTGYIYSSDMGTILYPKSSLSAYALITDRDVASRKLQANSSASDALMVLGGGTIAGTLTASYLTVTGTMGISGGFGVSTNWSPISDNTYNLGISGSYRWSHVYANNTTITTSDARKKTDVQNSALGLAFINSLRPVSYKWIVGRNEIVLDADGNPVIVGHDDNGKPIYESIEVPGVRTHYGLIAQEVKSALDAANVGDFAGWVQDDMNNPDSFQSLSYEQFIAPMLRAIQELSQEVNLLKGNK